MNRVARESLRWMRVIVGFILMIGAFALGFVPGIPGFPLALIGLALLATEFLWARRLNDWVKAKVRASLDKARAARGEKKPDEPG